MLTLLPCVRAVLSLTCVCVCVCVCVGPMQEQMFKRKGRAQGAAQNVLYSSWTPAADEAYQEWTARQRRTLVWAAVKQPATASDAPAGS